MIKSRSYQEIESLVTESHIKISTFRTPALSDATGSKGGALKLSRLSLFANTECTFFNLAFGGTHRWVQGFAWRMACYIGMLSPNPEVNG